MTTLDSVVRLNEEVLFQDLQGESVLLNLQSGVYFGLDVVGTRIWQLLQTNPSLTSVVQTITSEYDVTEDQCAKDLLALLGKLEEHKLIAVSEAQTAAVHGD